MLGISFWILFLPTILFCVYPWPGGGSVFYHPEASIPSHWDIGKPKQLAAEMEQNLV